MSCFWRRVQSQYAKGSGGLLRRHGRDEALPWLNSKKQEEMKELGDWNTPRNQMTPARAMLTPSYRSATFTSAKLAHSWATAPGSCTLSRTACAPKPTVKTDTITPGTSSSTACCPMVVPTPMRRSSARVAPTRPSSPRPAAANTCPVPSSSTWTPPQLTRSELEPTASCSTLSC